MRVRETSCCTIELPDAIECAPYEMACLSIMGDGAIPDKDKGSIFRVVRCMRTGALDVMKRVRKPDGIDLYLYCVTIDKRGIHDSGVLVYEAQGRQLVRTDLGKTLGWHLPGRETT